MTTPDADPGSFRDPAGRVFHRDGRVLRSVNRVAATDFEAVRDTGLLDELVSEGKLLAYEPVGRELLRDAAPEAVHVLEHPRLPYVSYPYEWPFPLLKAAALLHLDVHLAALARGVSLSDATAYNVQFRGPRPVFVDHLSFRPYRDGEFWAGHRQFCEEFLNPLLLRASCGIAHNDWYRGRLSGIPVTDLARLLPLRGKLSLNALTHVVLQARLQRSSNPSRAARSTAKRKLPLAAFVRMLEGLRAWIGKLHPADGGETVWQGYAERNSYDEEAAARKAAFVDSFVSARQPAVLCDFGCNIGNFAKISLDAGAGTVVGFDADHGALERAVARARAESLELLPLYLDATNPAPSQGWAEVERRGLHARAGADALLALALVHHLAIAGNVPLDRIVAWLVDNAPSGVIEFVPKGDPMVHELLRLRDDVFADYDAERFLKHVSERARVVRQERLSPGGRLLVAFERSG